MSRTRSSTAALATVTLAAGSASAAGWPDVPVDFVQGGHVQIRSAYLRPESQAEVRGMVRRAPLWRGPVTGHLDVTALGDSGEVARCAARWTGRLYPPVGAAAYGCQLGIARAEVKRLRVAYHGAPLEAEAAQ